MASTVLSKIIDGMPSNLAFLGIRVAATYTSTVFEEILELGIPIFLSIAAFSAFPTQDGGLDAPRRSHSTH